MFSAVIMPVIPRTPLQSAIVMPMTAPRSRPVLDAGTSWAKFVADQLHGRRRKHADSDWTLFATSAGSATRP